MSALATTRVGAATAAPSLISAALVTRAEPFDRLQRLVDALSVQVECGPIELVVAAPPDEHRQLASLSASGSLQAIRIVSNPTGRRSPGLNAAFRAARGDIVVRVDARSRPPKDYIARCARRLAAAPEIGICGAVQRPTPATEALRARAIARALAHPWLLGGAKYRRLKARGPTDTVYLGAFRREEVLALGGYNDALDANEDFDLCQRYRDAGFVVWLEPGLVVEYEARATFSAIWSQYFAFGQAKVRYWRRTGHGPNARQAVALATGAAAALVIAASFSRPRRLIGWCAGLGSTMLILDHAAGLREADPRVRIVAVAANGVVISGWLAGTASELLAQRVSSCARRQTPRN